MRLPSSPVIRDCLLAAVLTAATQVELVLGAEGVAGPLVVQHLVFAGMTASVALRRVAPLAATLGCSAGMALQTLAGEAPVVGGFLAMLVVVASLGYHASVRAGAVGLTAMASSALLYDVLAEEFVLGDMIANIVIVLGAWGFARMARVSTDRRVAAELAKDRFAREAVAAERTRIARDLHDSVAHALTLMTLQAGGARERASDPVVVDALQRIEEGGREALSDMHRFLRLLGDPDDGPGEAPGLRNLDDMVQRVRAGGLEVNLTFDGELEDLPASVSSTAYRIVQEGLTNAIKHSDARRATVAIRLDRGSLCVDVSDDGAVADVHRRIHVGSGGGLPGLRERVALFDGSLTAGKVDDKGWRLEATIPLAAPLAAQQPP
ncbi:MAG TPA: sensor histidine kinase [Nocardioidaceae bacterium]|nr:sensor histidine kinase [Nocardioidaceae bacterium]